MSAVTARTKAELDTAITDDLADNTAGAITPAIHRAILEDFVDTVVTNPPLIWEDLALTTSSAALNLPGTSTRYIVPSTGDLEIVGQLDNSGAKDYGALYWRGPADWLGVPVRMPVEADRYIEFIVSAFGGASIRANNTDVGNLRRFRIRHYDG